MTTTGAWLVSHKANATVIREGPGQSGNYPLRVGDSHHLVTDVNGTITIRHPNGPFGHPGSHQLWHFWH